MPSSVFFDESSWVERRTSFSLFKAIADCTGDALTGLHIAELLQLEDYGALGVGILRSPTLLDALHFAQRGVCQVETGTELGLVVDGAVARLSLSFVGPLEGDPHHHEDANLAVLMKIIALTREVVDVRARLPYPRLHSEDPESALGSNLEFDSERGELVFDRDALLLPLRPYEGALPVPMADQHNIRAATARAVLEAIQICIEFERPTILGVAAVLSLEPRTIQRHLSTCGVTFLQLLEEYRIRTALAQLRARDRTITDIAFRLGYSDSAHFTRAFRRWTGHAPKDLLKVPETTAGTPPAIAFHSISSNSPGFHVLSNQDSPGP
jgi:AraC-like DNA-binding protein